MSIEEMIAEAVELEKRAAGLREAASRKAKELGLVKMQGKAGPRGPHSESISQKIRDFLRSEPSGLFTATEIEESLGLGYRSLHSLLYGRTLRRDLRVVYSDGTVRYGWPEQAGG